MTTTILDAAAIIARRTRKDPLTPRWRATLTAFYGLPLTDTDVDELAQSTKRTKAALRQLSIEAGINRRAFRELWARVGRRGRKSCDAALVAVFEALFGGHERYLLDGERGLIAVISKDIAGSTAVARFAELHAQALGITCRWTTMGAVRILELDGCPFGIACFPCSATAPRGYAIPIVICDEIAHWATDAEEYVNADTAVLSAVKPAMAQFPDSKLIAISSPLGKIGAFHDTVERNLGDDAAPGVLAVEGPTWLWNPEITEQRTRELEPDEQIHAREFGAIPSEHENEALPASDVLASFGAPYPPTLLGGFVTIDPSSLRGDAFAVGAGRFLPGDGFALLEVKGWTAADLLRDSLADIVDDIAALASRYGTTEIYSDQREAAGLRTLLAEKDLVLRDYAWSEPSKDKAVMWLRRAMRERRVWLCEHDKMRQQLLGMKARLTAHGRISYPTNGLDHASTLITLAHAFLAGHAGGAYEPEPPPPSNDIERAIAEMAARKQKLIERAQRAQDPDDDAWILGPG